MTNKRVSLARLTREVYLPEAGTLYATCGLSRPTQYIRSPRSSTRGSFPKHLRRKLAQSNRPGFERFFYPSSIKTAANVRVMERGASSPKYRMPCRRASGTCCIRIRRNFSVENRSVWNLSFLVSFAKYSTVLSLTMLRRCRAIGGRRMYRPA